MLAYVCDVFFSITGIFRPCFHRGPAVARVNRVLASGLIISFPFQKDRFLPLRLSSPTLFPLFSYRKLDAAPLLWDDMF